MVSFFRKKKKSAEAKKDGDTKELQPPSQPIVAVEANAPTPRSAALAPPAASGGQATETTTKRSASYPTKRRNFLAGSLRGSRSSVSRLPAVQEEISNQSALIPHQTPSEDEQAMMTDTTMMSTPATIPSSTPDLLGSLSFDDQEEGQVEILTPSAKDQVKKQLQFESPSRGSRVASMEVTPDGIVSQISQDEDADILIGTTTVDVSPEEEAQQTNSATTASTTVSSQLHHDAVSQSPSSTPSRFTMAPKPKSSPLFVNVKPGGQTDEGHQQKQHEEEQDDGDQGAPLDQGSTDTEDITATRQAAAAAISPSSYEEEEVVGSNDPPRTHEVPPTRTISLEQNRLNLVSPLTMHPNAKEHHEVGREHQPPGDLDVEEEEDTLEETAEDTLADNTYESSTSRTASANDWTKNYDDNNPIHRMERKMQEVAKSLMNSLQCTPEQVQKVAENPIQGTMSMFYDGMCKPEDMDENPRRPYFNEDFAQRFVKRMLTNGMSLLYLQPPHTASNPTDDWKGRTVVMKIVPGSTGDQVAIQPKLQWTTMPGGAVTKAYMTSLPLLRIHSVLTAAQNVVPEDSTTVNLEEDDLCFVSITSAAGKVFLFEANSVRERDEIANGLRNIIARLSFHLVAGDHQASTELYNDDRAIQEETEPGDLPALANPKLNMNRMTHLLLEA